VSGDTTNNTVWGDGGNMTNNNTVSGDSGDTANDNKVMEVLLLKKIPAFWDVMPR
jgi:hypothetical protein